MPRVSGTSFVLARTEGKGDLQDIRIFTTAQGLNQVEIARDAKDTSRRIYVVDRRVLPDGAWKKLLEVESFSDDAPPERASEVRATVEFEEIPNVWGIRPERTWGLPSGMESPWTEPIEMVGNEILLPVDAKYVSGDAPINIAHTNQYQNGKYRVVIGNGIIQISSLDGENIGTIFADTSHLSWSEGTAGAASFLGGSMYIEPAKPPLFQGEFYLGGQPERMGDGLYRWGNHFLVSSVEIQGGRGVGAIAFLNDPFPERWVPRMFGRAFVTLLSPAFVPPLAEDQPQRVGVEVHFVDTDYPDLRPIVRTPYADKTGVFNAWALDSAAVSYAPREAPYDVLIPFDQRLQEWGGFALDYPGIFIPANDFQGEPNASFPNQQGYVLPDLPPMSEGTMFYRWKESAFFYPFRSDWMKVAYREGWIYFSNLVSPQSTGIAPLIVAGGWNNTKIEWKTNTLMVNDVPALTEELTWQQALTSPETGDRTWGEVLGIPASQWKASGDIPMDIEQWEEVPPDWETGSPEGEVPLPDPDYSERPRTWGRVLYEDLYPEEPEPEG